MNTTLTKAEIIAAGNVPALTRMLRSELIKNKDNIPTDLKALKCWLAWKVTNIDQKTGKFNKIPVYPRSLQQRHGKQGGDADMANLGTWKEVDNALETNKSLAGVGVAMVPSFNIVALDVDCCIENGAFPEDIQRLTDLTYCEFSPSGTGVRALWRGAAADGKNHLDGLELFHGKGFVTITGNRVENTLWMAESADEPLPLLEPELKAELEQRSRASRKPSTNDGPSEEHLRDATSCEEVSSQTIAELRSALRFIPADDRELWQCIGHRLKTLGENGRVLFMEWSATSDKFNLHADAKTWESFKPTRTSWRGVFSEAQRLGWINPMGHADESFNSASGVAFHSSEENSPQAEGINPANHSSDPVARLERNIIALDVLENPFDVLPHYVNKWIPGNEVTLLAGHGGSGKSYVALSIAMHVTLGLPFANLNTTQANVLFFSGEDGEPVLKHRLSRLCQVLKVDPDQLAGKLHLLDASDIDPALHREQRVHIYGQQQVVTETVLLNVLAQLVTKLNVSLVIIDNASDAYDDDEIKRARVRRFVRSLRKRIARPDRAVLLLAHVNKASASGGRDSGTEDYSGSTAWHNSARSRLSLISDSNGILTIEHMKANLGPKSEPVQMEWREGVPVVSRTYGEETSESGGRSRDEVDKTALVALIQDFEKRGEDVTTSFQGSATVYRLLKGEPGFPKNTTSERLMRLLRSLEKEGRILRREIKTRHRKLKQVFVCAPITSDA